jgi:hypothetical protein
MRMKNVRNYKLYIIGNIPEKITRSTIKRFLNAEELLIPYRVHVINPIRSYRQKNLSREDAFKINIQELMQANGVYLLNETNFFYKNSVELKLAFALNLTVIHQPFHLFDISDRDQAKLIFHNL